MPETSVPITIFARAVNLADNQGRYSGQGRAHWSPLLQKTHTTFYASIVTHTTRSLRRVQRLVMRVLRRPLNSLRKYQKGKHNRH